MPSTKKLNTFEWLLDVFCKAAFVGFNNYNAVLHTIEALMHYFYHLHNIHKGFTLHFSVKCSKAFKQGLLLSSELWTSKAVRWCFSDRLDTCTDMQITLVDVWVGWLFIKHISCPSQQPWTRDSIFCSEHSYCLCKAIALFPTIYCTLAYTKIFNAFLSATCPIDSTKS